MNYKDYNDYELLYMIRENDDEAMNIMIGKYEPIIKKMASSFSYNYNYLVEKEELIQEGRIAVFKAIKTYSDEKALFYTYVGVAIKNAMLCYCAKHFNKNKVSNYSLCIDDIDYEVGYSVDYTGFCNDIDFDEVIISFKNILSFEDACIFELRYNYFSYKDIAMLLDLTEKRIDNRLYKIKISLRKYLCKSNK